MNISEIRAILFDLDGVLWNSLEVHESAYKEIFAKYGLPDLQYQEITGRSTREVFNDFVKGKDLPNDRELVESLVLEKQKLARKNLAKVEVSKEIVNGLVLLKQYFRIALVSGTSAQSGAVFLGNFQKNFFDVTVFGDQGIPAKPRPDPFLRAAIILNVSPPSCIAVEDSKAGIESVRSAQMELAHVTGPKPCSLSFSHMCFLKTEDFIAHILDLC